MFTLKDFKVELKNPEEVKEFVKRHGEFSKVCYNTPKEKAEKVGEHCLESGHLSGSRHLYMVFELENVPRSLIDQLVRHEQGVVKNVQSLRYCNKKEDVNVYVAPEVMKDVYLRAEIIGIEQIIRESYENIQATLKDAGLTGEKSNEIARTILPIGISTKCSFAVNLEGLIHLANVRLCNRAELPIRTIVKEMVEQVVEVEPRYKPFLVPNCKKLGYCPEGEHSCKK